MWVVLLLSVVIICTTILIGMYIYYCSENEVGLFEKPKYNERINKMEKQIRELEEKIFLE
jgi:hypothetical protein